MPIYEYRCSRCANEFEVLQKPTDGPEGVVCPSCGNPKAEKLVSSCCAPSSHKSEGAAGTSSCSTRKFG
jgi:putative FmdB family regulatory protein